MTPVFDFSCPKCGRKEEDVMIGREGKDIVCPECGCKMKRKPSVFNPMFRGNDFTPIFFKDKAR